MAAMIISRLGIDDFKSGNIMDKLKRFFYGEARQNFARRGGKEFLEN